MQRKPKEKLCEAIIKVEPSVRDLMKSKARKSQRYSDYILELIEYKEQHERSFEDGKIVDSCFRGEKSTISETLKPRSGKKLE